VRYGPARHPAAVSIAALARARLTAVTSRARAAFATLTDWRGGKVNTAALKNPPATRQPKRASTQFGADPERLVSLFKKADEGDPRELQQLLTEVEARDAHIGGVLDTRYKAATRVALRAVAATDDARDVEIAEAVQRDIYDAPWFRTMARDLLSGIVLGWAVCSIRWETGDVWKPVELRPVDQGLTAVDPLDDQRLQWRDPADLTKLQPIEPYTAIVHTATSPSGPLFRRGIGRSLAILYSLKRLGLQAFATFVELYGVARPVVDYLDGTLAEDLDKLQADLEEWQSAGYLMKPHGVTVTFPEPTRDSTGDPIHKALADFCDAQASKRIVGQTMTSDAGSSRSQAEVHERVAEHILEGDVLDLVATVLRDLVTPYVQMNYGEDVAVPACQPQLEANGQRAFQLEVLKVLVPLGLEVEQSVARDLGGLPAPAKGARILGAKGPATASAQATASRKARRGSAARGPGVLYAATSIPAPNPHGGDESAGSDRHAALSSRPPTPTVTLAEDDAGDDFIDRDGGAAADAGWREGMQPFVVGAQAAADAADGFDDFLVKLREQTEIDGDAYVRALATWTMQARGVGDGTDDT